MIAVGGREHTPTIDDYEATITLLTALLYTIAQLPNGTHAQRRVFGAFQRLERALRVAGAPVRAAEHAGEWLRERVDSAPSERSRAKRIAPIAGYRDAVREEEQRRQETGAPAGGEAAGYAMARLVAPSDPQRVAVEAFDAVAANLGWWRDTDKIVFAHTISPLTVLRRRTERVGYWNPGSWILEPDLSSREAYLGYLRNAWPGTAVVIDEADAEPRLLRLREHLNPIHRLNGRGRSR